MATTQSHLSKEDQAKRVADAKAKAAKSTKSKFGPPTGQPAKSGDQKPVTQATDKDPQVAQAGDQSDVKPKAKRAPSPQVIRWKARMKEPLDMQAKITVNQEAYAAKPKRNNAKTKFAVYKNGMTVAEYIEASNKIGTSKATAKADVVWDLEAGFISLSQ